MHHQAIGPYSSRSVVRAQNQSPISMRLSFLCRTSRFLECPFILSASYQLGKFWVRPSELNGLLGIGKDYATTRYLCRLGHRNHLSEMPTIHPVSCQGMDLKIESIRSRATWRREYARFLEFHLVTKNLSMVDYNLSTIDLKENKNV